MFFYVLHLLWFFLGLVFLFPAFCFLIKFSLFTFFPLREFIRCFIFKPGVVGRMEEEESDSRTCTFSFVLKLPAFYLIQLERIIQRKEKWTGVGVSSWQCLVTPSLSPVPIDHKQSVTSDFSSDSLSAWGQADSICLLSQPFPSSHPEVLLQRCGVM